MYAGRLKHITAAYKKGTETPQVSIVFEVGDNRKAIWLNLNMDEKAAKFVNWQTEVLGVASYSDIQDKMTRAHRIKNDLERKLGNIYNLEVSKNEYNGKIYTNAVVKSLRQENGSNYKPTNRQITEVDRVSGQDFNKIQKQVTTVKPQVSETDEFGF